MTLFTLPMSRPFGRAFFAPTAAVTAAVPREAEPAGSASSPTLYRFFVTGKVTIAIELELGAWRRGGRTPQAVERLLGESSARRIGIGLEQQLVRRPCCFGRTQRFLRLAALVVRLGHPHRAREFLNSCCVGVHRVAVSLLLRVRLTEHELRFGGGLTGGEGLEQRFEAAHGRRVGP